MKKGSGPVALKSRKAAEAETRQITATVPLDFYVKLQQLAAKEKRSVSFLICEAVDGLLKEKAA